MRFSIDTRKSAPENAEHYYSEAKKAERKIAGAEKALEDTRKKIAKLREEYRILEEEATQAPEKKEKKEKKWFEAFRYFQSSDGFLVLGGKDASNNEFLIKKHTDKNDVVFHADVQGAPFFVVKNPENKEIPETTLKEAAEAAASYSKAWQVGWGSCDVYYVAPEQVSKTTKAGEHIAKGAFMIYGKKNWQKATALGIGVGFDSKEGVISGPVSAVEKKTSRIVNIIPGEKKSKELAAEVKNAMLKNAGKEDAERIKAVRLEDIQRLIPSGRGRVRK